MDLWSGQIRGRMERDRMTHYRPFPILKNRAKFFFTLREGVSDRFPPPRRHHVTPSRTN